MIYADSEIAPLKKVIVHRPDAGIGRVSPRRAEELLFDDIVYLPRMQEEHDIFTQVLHLFLGEDNVMDTEQLLIESLEVDKDKTQALIANVLDFEELPTSYKEIFSSFSISELANVLITGYHGDEDHIFFDPIPNFIFTRDIAVTIKDHVIITKAAKGARQRENILTRFIFKTHPLFSDLAKDDKIINLNDFELFPPSRMGEQVSIEGGDIMMFANDFLLIGCSERTTDHAMQSIKKVVFDKQLVKYVVQINIPNDRSMMHIDTLFTRVDVNDIACYKPIIFDGVSSNVIVHGDDGSRAVFSSVQEFISNMINPNMSYIFSGNGVSPYQEREQWTDGCNLVAIRPGVGITYDRNHRTGKAFENAGYKVIAARELLNDVHSGKIKVEDIHKTIITLPSGELSRARGGSHCMTCPIVREKLV